jgi:eukaryotic-like serine/threonine-protein kinase
MRDKRPPAGRPVFLENTGFDLHKQRGERVIMGPLDHLSFDHLVGREVGTAVLLKELARGGMAVIFIAYQKTLKRQIAVKILPKELITPSAADLFQQEAESAAILSHPNIVPIYEVGETEDFLFFTMQLIRGLPLSRILKRTQQHLLPSKRFFPLKDTVRILTSVLDALDYAHRQDIIHRDIKPANILIEAHSNRPIITDFGIARVLRGPNVDAPTVLGTPFYMAPEQITGERVDARTDIYAVGVMLFEMLVMTLPLPGYSTALELLRMKVGLKDQLFQHKPSELNPSVNQEMDRIVFKALAYEPEKRYASCREFIDSLNRYRDLHLGRD